MLEIIATITLVVLLGWIGAALYGFTQVVAILREAEAAAARAEFRNAQSLEGIAQAQSEGSSMLKEALAQLPKKGKPGRKPGSGAGASASAKRGPKQKAAPAIGATPAPEQPAPAAPPPELLRIVNP